MGIEIPHTAKAVIESGRLAHFTTINADGRPHTTVVWVGLGTDADGGDEVLIGKLAVDQKVTNIRRDPRVTFSMEADGDVMGMKNYLVVEGIATITEGGAPELLGELAKRYIGPDANFPPMQDPPDGFVIHITPTKLRGTGPWTQPT
jgi:PPOX class probable F420-dependent enzyme